MNLEESNLFMRAFFTRWAGYVLVFVVLGFFCRLVCFITCSVYRL